MNPDLAAAHTSLAAVAHMQGDYAAAAAEAEKALVIDPTDARAMQLRYRRLPPGGRQGEGQRGGAGTAGARRPQRNGRADLQRGRGCVQRRRHGHCDFEIPTGRRSRPESGPGATWCWPSSSSPKEICPRRWREPRRSWRWSRTTARRCASRTTRPCAWVTPKKLPRPSTASPDSDPEWAATGLFKLAVELYNNGQTEAAAQALERVLQADPDHARAHYLLGVAQFNSGQTEPASEHLQRFLELAPEDPDAAIARDLLSYSN